MRHFSDIAADKRRGNAKVPDAFPKATVSDAETVALEGSGPTVYTIGYERRSGEELIDCLNFHDVDVLVDVRQRAMSRRPDFRGSALRRFCSAADIEYYPMPSLGSTDKLRDQLRESGDFSKFAKQFRASVRRSRMDTIEELGRIASKATIALLCYERCHAECHRSVVADFLNQVFDARIIAIE